MVIMAAQTKIHMNVAEYEALPDSRHPIQLIEGELVETEMPTPRHQRISRQINALLSQLRPDGEGLYAPVPVFLSETNVFEPDVMWLAPESQAVISERGVEGIPELVIEILSPSTARYDRMVKFQLYEKYGAREYWLVDPRLRVIDVWNREGSEFTSLGAFHETESFDSPLLERTVNLTAIFSGIE